MLALSKLIDESTFIEIRSRIRQNKVINYYSNSGIDYLFIRVIKSKNNEIVVDIFIKYNMLDCYQISFPIHIFNNFSYKDLKALYKYGILYHKKKHYSNYVCSVNETEFIVNVQNKIIRFGV